MELLEQLEPRVFLTNTVAPCPPNGYQHSAVMGPYDPRESIVFTVDKGNPHNIPVISPVMPPPPPAPKDYPNPSDIGQIHYNAGSLWGDLGVPTPEDVIQGGLGDCWLLGPFQSQARFNPTRIMEMMHADPNGGYDGEVFGQWIHIPDGFAWFQAQIGPHNALWPEVGEKLLASYWGSYNAENGGWPTTAYQAFNWNVFAWGMPTTQQGLIDLVNTELRQSVGICVGTLSNSVALIGSHCYSIFAVTPDGQFVLRNPWGVDGTAALPDANPYDGYVTIDFNTLYASIWTGQIVGGL